MNEASLFAPHVDRLFFFLLLICGVVFFLILFFIFYFIKKYHSSVNIDRSNPPTSNFTLEMAWTIPSLLIFLFFFFWGEKLYSYSRSVHESDLEIFVIAKQWMWKFQHQDGRREVDELHIPVGKKVKLTMISEDVIHSLFIPDFRIKQDLLPQRYTSLIFQATTPGIYPVLCTQYCGVNHSRMLAKVIVMNDLEFANWNQSAGTRIQVQKIIGQENLVGSGKILFEKIGCSTCHSSTPPSEQTEIMIGPSLWNIYNSMVTLKNGEKIRADESYIRESVFDPNAKVVKNFNPVMPTFEGILSEEDFQKILVYIKSLKTR